MSHYVQQVHIKTISHPFIFRWYHIMESVAFGTTDGIICFLGIIVGVARATFDAKAVIIASVIGGIADALGNSIGFFVSQSTERAVQIVDSTNGDGGRIHTKREVYLSGAGAFAATIVAMVVLIWPFFVFPVWVATAVSFVIGFLLASTLGYFIGVLEKINTFKCALKYALITLAGTIVCYGVGELLGLLLHTH
jgi:predicted membrane protein (TIGR00267 family)